MYTVFIIRTEFNPSIAPKIFEQYSKVRRQRKTGVVHYRGLNWRILDNEHLEVEIYDQTIKVLPKALRSAVISEMAIYDFLHDVEIEFGLYRYRTAWAFIRLDTPDGKEVVTEIEIRGELLHHMTELYDRLLKGKAKPVVR